MSEWQLAQELVLCTDVLNRASSMKSEMPWPVELVLKSSLSAWQSRQKLFLSCGGEEMAEADGSSAAQRARRVRNPTTNTDPESLNRIESGRNEAMPSQHHSSPMY